MFKEMKFADWMHLLGVIATFLGVVVATYSAYQSRIDAEIAEDALAKITAIEEQSENNAEKSQSAVESISQLHSEVKGIQNRTAKSADAVESAVGIVSTIQQSTILIFHRFFVTEIRINSDIGFERSCDWIDDSNRGCREVVGTIDQFFREYQRYLDDNFAFLTGRNQVLLCDELGSLVSHFRRLQKENFHAYRKVERWSDARCAKKPNATNTTVEASQIYINKLKNSNYRNDWEFEIDASKLHLNTISNLETLVGLKSFRLVGDIDSVLPVIEPLSGVAKKLKILNFMVDAEVPEEILRQVKKSYGVNILK